MEMSKKQNGVVVYFVVYWNFLFSLQTLNFFLSTFLCLFYSCSARSGILKTALNPSLTLKITYIIKLKYKFLIFLGDFCSLFFFSFSSNTLFFLLFVFNFFYFFDFTRKMQVMWTSGWFYSLPACVNCSNRSYLGSWLSPLLDFFNWN